MTKIPSASLFTRVAVESIFRTYINAPPIINHLSSYSLAGLITKTAGLRDSFILGMTRSIGFLWQKQLFDPRLKPTTEDEKEVEPLLIAKDLLSAGSGIFLAYFSTKIVTEMSLQDFVLLETLASLFSKTLPLLAKREPLSKIRALFYLGPNDFSFNLES